MATLITRSNLHRGLTGSPEKRVDYTPDGAMWLLLVEGGIARFWRSGDGGATWQNFSNSNLDTTYGHTLPSFYIDADGYAHVSWALWNRKPQTVRYARGTPRSGGGWSWKQFSFQSSWGRIEADTDVIAFRDGSGWSVWVLYESFSGPIVAKIVRLRVSADGSIRVADGFAGPLEGASGRDKGALSFTHTGDGKTPTTNPDILLMTGDQYSAEPIRFQRAVRDGDLWTWDPPVEVDPSAIARNTAMVSTFDGERLYGAWSPGASGAPRFAEWVPGAATGTRRDLPAFPAGVDDIAGISMGVDPITKDVYLACYDVTDGDLRWSVLPRSTLTWSPWEVAAVRAPNSRDGKVQMPRNLRGTNVDLVYGDPLGDDKFNIYYLSLDTLQRAPAAPTLLEPIAGARAALNEGATFRWQYNPYSRGDEQAAWLLRRSVGETHVYWNQAAQSWSTPEVWNPGADQQATFGPGWWPSDTYSWRVTTRSTTGLDSPPSAARTVVSTTAPVVEVTAPYALHYGETNPLVTWVYTSAEAQRQYEVRIVVASSTTDWTNPGPVVWGSGLVSSATARSQRVDSPLQLNTTYRAYVRVVSELGSESWWNYSEFTLAAEAPAGPVIEARDEIAYGTDVPRIELRMVGRTNYLGLTQAVGHSGWETEGGNTTLAAQDQDLDAQLEQGMRLTSLAAGSVMVRTAPGSPPEVPVGEVQPLGPLDFPVLARQDYTAMAKAKAAGALRPVQVGIRWYSVDDGTAAVRTNLVTNPAFGVDTAGWTPAGIVTLTRDATVTSAGRPSAKVEQTASQGGWITTEASVDGDVAYDLSARVLADAETTFTLSVDYYDVEGVRLGGDDVEHLYPSAGQWAQITHRSYAPAGSVRADVTIASYGRNAVGAVWWTTRVLFERVLPTGVVGDYFDGDTVDTAGLDNAWTGTAHASTSTQTDTTGGLISEVWSEAGVTGSAAYEQVSVTAEAPALARLARMVVRIDSIAAVDEVFHVTALSLHPGDSTAWTGGGSTETMSMRAERSIDGGTTWEPLGRSLRPDYYQVAVAYDRTFPFGQDVKYRCYTDVATGPTSVLTSQVSPVATIRVNHDAWVIRDPEDEDVEVNALVVGHDSGDADDAQVYRPAGRTYAIVDSEGPHGLEGELEIYVPPSQVEATVATLRAGVAMLVQSPAGEVLRVRFMQRDYDVEASRARVITARYVQVG